MHNGPLPKQYFENLDGLRFVLAIMVFLQHSLFVFSIQEVVHVDLIQRLVSVIGNGYYAVSFFFVLSGFLITYLMLREQETTSAFNLRNFYMRRILRIWPMYYAVLLFSFVVYPAIKTRIGYADQNPFNILYQLFFLSNFDNIHVAKMGLTGVAPMMISINWSIAIEEQFYFVWPLLFLLFRGQKFIVAILAVLLTSWAFHLTGNDTDKQYYHTLYVMSDLAVGACFAYFAFYREQQVLSFFKSIPKAAIILTYIAGIIFLMYPDFAHDLLSISGTRIISTLFFVFILLEQSYSPNSFFKFSRFKRLSSLGKYTFSLYMLHPIGIQAAILIFRYAGYQRETSFGLAMFFVLIAFIVAFSLTVISYNLVESKFLKLRKKFS